MTSPSSGRCRCRCRCRCRHVRPLPIRRRKRLRDLPHNIAALTMIAAVFLLLLAGATVAANDAAATADVVATEEAVEVEVEAVAAASLAFAAAPPAETMVDDSDDSDYGNHNIAWEDGPSSWSEFGHPNDPSVCGIPRITVDEWEMGRYWDTDRPCIVTNATAGWDANRNWKLEEMLRRYGNAEATMGDGRKVGEYGPDEAGNLLTPTTVREFITEHMYNPAKYFFDRKIAIPKGMLEDCHPFPMPTRDFLEYGPTAGGIYAQSKKRKVNPRPESEMWQDHLAISIGSDLQGLSFHYHGQAWNAVVFGKKRWIIYDNARWESNITRQRYMALAGPDEDVLSSPEWIRRLYDDPVRKSEIRAHGHDCIQHAGEMMFVPRQWMHMVVNIGDTVSVISEVGLERGEGKKAEDFMYDPEEESSSSSGDYDSEEDDWSEDWDEEEGGPPVRRGRPPPGYGRPPPGYYWSGDDNSEDE